MVDIAVRYGGTFHEKDGGAGAEVVVAWLNWILRDDSDAGARFTGSNSGYCDDERFTLLRKSVD